jgi:diguanylate cyclase (GGDEF)-like protein
MIIDADYFKAINDGHGHPVGDAVLRYLADAIQGSLRKMDLVARVGGEEFAVILPSTPGVDACRAAEHCRLAIAASDFQSDGLCVPLTISIGVTVVALVDDGDSLLSRADQALYAAKQAGRNCIRFHDGQRCCEPTDASAFADGEPRPLAADNASAPGNENNADLLAVCRNLRERLAEMAEER